MEVEEEGDLYTYRYTVTTRMNFRIKVGSYESHFNVSVGSDGQCPQTTTFLKRKESRSGIEPKPFRLPAEHLTTRPNRPTHSRGPMYIYILIMGPCS